MHGVLNVKAPTGGGLLCDFGNLDDGSLAALVTTARYTELLQVVRGGQLVTPVPTVVTRLRGPPRPWAHTRLLDQGRSSFVLPGPATIMDGVYNNHYLHTEHMRADIGTLLCPRNDGF